MSFRLTKIKKYQQEKWERLCVSLQNAHFIETLKTKSLVPPQIIRICQWEVCMVGRRTSAFVKGMIIYCFWGLICFWWRQIAVSSWLGSRRNGQCAELPAWRFHSVCTRSENRGCPLSTYYFHTGTWAISMPITTRFSIMAHGRSRLGHNDRGYTKQKNMDQLPRNRSGPNARNTNPPKHAPRGNSLYTIGADLWTKCTSRVHWRWAWKC